MITQSDIKTINKIIHPLLEMKAWGVSLGEGSFITIEFGNKIPIIGKNTRQHGEWHLWIYCCAWFIEKDGKILAASEDPKEKMNLAIRNLENRILKSLTLSPPAFETDIFFDKGIILHLFPVHSEDLDHWYLYTPDGNVLTIGPGTNWSFKSSSSEEEIRD